MIPDNYFKIIVKYAPLISVDLIVKYRDEVFLGKRVNKLAKNFYFTPGGIIRKNETINAAIVRIAKEELNIKLKEIPNFLGVFEHFYEDSIFSNISTHYINLGYILETDKKLINLPEKQHSEYKWFTITELKKAKNVHRYVKQYF